MKSTYGRYLLQPNKDFPADCEMLDYLQTNTHIVSVIGNIAGDKAILLGCQGTGAGTHHAEGYVFLRTAEHPEGEVLYWEGGATDGGIYLRQEAIAVQAQGYDYPQAYVSRSLAPGIGAENYKWSDFTDALTLPALKKELEEIRKALAAQKRSPLGIVELWAGQGIPDDYLPCEGQQLRQTDYPALYTAIGTMYNNGYDCNGGQLSTTPGLFRLPDLRSRFIVGHNPSDADYKTIGAVGGEKKHLLTLEELPPHSHKLPWDNWHDRYTGGGSDNFLGPHGGNTEIEGGGKTHENRPPYYTLAYIMRIK